MRRLAASFAATIFALPVWADQLPSLVPAHDISGTYVFTDTQGTQTVAIEYSKDVNVMRLTPQAGATSALYAGDAYILYDFTANDAKMVLPQMQRYFEQPELVGRMQRILGDISDAGGNVTAGAVENIAGYDCTDYTSGGSASLCVTSDGVLLKFSAANGDGAVAQSMSYDGVSVVDVQLPPGYTEIPTPPAGNAPQ